MVREGKVEEPNGCDPLISGFDSHPSHQKWVMLTSVGSLTLQASDPNFGWRKEVKECQR